MQMETEAIPGLSQEEVEAIDKWDEEQVCETASAVYAAGVRRANELDGATWTRYSISIWSDIRKSAEEVALKHPAMSLPRLPGGSLNASPCVA